jgi:hypothetical protein
VEVLPAMKNPDTKVCIKFRKEKFLRGNLQEAA